MSNIYTFTDGCSIDLDTERPTVTKAQLAELKQDPDAYKLFSERVNAFNRARYRAKTTDPAYKEKLQAQRKEWRKSPEGKEHLAAYMRKYREGSQQSRIASSIRGTIHAALFKDSNICSAESYLGCSVEDYKEYLENHFSEGMSWENYGLGIGKWCIDHIRSVSTFDLTKPNQVIECFFHKNTRPMWFKGNAAKWQKEKAALAGRSPLPLPFPPVSDPSPSSPLPLPVSPS